MERTNTTAHNDRKHFLQKGIRVAGFYTAVHQVEGIEKPLGINVLAQFTPNL